jgi:hypothetical protein
MELAILVLLAACIFLYLRWSKIKKRYAGYEVLLPVAEEMSKRKADLAALESKIEEIRVEHAKLDAVRSEREHLEAHVRELEAVELLHDSGFYEPRYSFDTSERYQKRLDEVRTKQKTLLESGAALNSSQTWTIGGSEKKGEQLTKRISKLMLRAFQGESDTVIAKVKYGNVETYAEKIRRAKDAINKLGDTWGLSITDSFVELILEELYLVYEYQEKVAEEREEQRRIREEMKEEERVRREAERAQQEAEKEERRAQEALDKARKEMEGKQGSELEAMQQQLAELQRLVDEAGARKERALSQAQQTRRGHVYVISNIGSFGEDVFKIGMTRRLEPMDRIKELGDASVPFMFDVHAIIYSDDAPNMEMTLHRKFHQRRVNRVNEKREFFRVTLDEIVDEVKRIDGMADVEFTLVAEAREYRETLALSQS